MDGRIDSRTHSGGATRPVRLRETLWGAWVRRVGRAWGLFVLLGMLLGPVGTLVAQPAPRVTARVSVDSVKVGERFTLTLAAEYAAEEVIFPTPDDGSALFGDLSVIRRGEVRGRRASDGRRVDSVAYEVAAFAVDAARVPVLPVRFVAGGDTTIAGTPPQTVPMISVVGPDADVLRTPALLASFQRSLWGWSLLGLLAVILLGGLTYVWWRLRNDGEGAESVEEDTRSPYEVASARLQQLERRNPNDRHSCKAFYVDLSEALRVYLAARVGIRALECTTPEVISALHRHPNMSDEAIQRVRAVLEWADLVKFAGVEPEPEESRTVLRKARGVLDTIEAAQRRAERATRTEEVSAPA